MPNLMTFLPIVDRELRVASRRHGTYSMRLAIALAAIVIGLFLYMASVRLPSATMAHHLFEGLSVVGLIYCLASGRRFTADSVSEEKREGTLGLLFLTELRGYDIILGKLAATSLNGFFCLLAIFPVLAVPLLMGGITNGEFWRTVAVLVDTFLFSLAIGVFASVPSWNPRRAMGANFFWWLLLAGALPACAGIVAYFSPTHIVVTELLYSCPGFAFYLAFEGNYRWHAADFWWSVAVVHILTWLLVALASLVVSRCWQDRPAARGKLRWRERWESWVYGNPSRRRSLRRRLLEVNAFYWLASRAWFKPVGVWVALVFVAAWWIYMRLQLHFNWFDEMFVFTTVVLLNCLLKLWIAVETGQRLAEDQKIGALELLLSTPLRSGELLRGQLLALRRQFLWPLVLVFVCEVFLVFVAPRQEFQMDSRMRSFGIAALFSLVTDLIALIGVAMEMALTARSPNHASVHTIFRVLILPWIVFGMIIALTNVWVATLGGNSFSWKFYLGMWLALGIVADLAFGVPAWWRLRTQFRHIALRRALASRQA